MRIAVYGAGGVGGYFGGRLAQAGTDVHLIARGSHLEALRVHGLRVRSVKGDFAVRVPATDDPAEVGPCDYVLFCVKAFDTESAAARLGPLLGEGTAVLSLQNGVDNEDKLAQAIGPDHVMGGAAFIFAGKAAPGMIVHTGGPTSITFGELDGRVSERGQRLLECCQRAGFAAELSESIKTVLWAKFAFICAQAGMTAAVRLPIGELRTVDAAWAGFQRLVAEVAAVAEADGSPIPAAAQQRALALAQSVEPGSFSSLHDDLVAGRRMELEALHGLVVRRAAEHGVPVPMSEAVQGLVIVRVWPVGDVGLRGPRWTKSRHGARDHVGIEAHDQTGPPWRVARPHCCGRAPSEPCVRVVPAHGSSKPREDPLPQTPYVALDPLPVDRQPRQGLALRSVHPRRSRGVQLAPRFPRRRHRAPSPAHLTHVGALSGRGTRPRIRPVPRRQPLGGAARCLTVLSPFGAPALACWVILRPLGLCAFLTVGLPSQARTPSGLPRCPRARSDRDWVPSILRGCGAHPAGTGNPAVAGRLTAAHPYTQVLPPPSPGLG